MFWSAYVLAAHFGEVPGAPVGTVFDSRRALYEAGVHRVTEAGIAGGESEGADSIIVSGGYEDDKDFGDVVVYTGKADETERPASKSAIRR
jgi:putative restriction endonuclease